MSILLIALKLLAIVALLESAVVLAFRSLAARNYYR